MEGETDIEERKQFWKKNWDIRRKNRICKRTWGNYNAKSRGEKTIEKEEEKPEDTTDLLKALKLSINHPAAGNPKTRHY